MSKKTLLKIIQYIVFLGLGVGIIYYMSSQLSDEEKTEMVNAIKGVRIGWLVPIFIAGFLSHLFRALRWKLLMEPLNIRPTTLNTTAAVLIGYIANLFIPRAGEVAKCTVLARYENVPADKMIGTIVAERAFDVLSLVTVTTIAFLLQADIIGSYATNLLSAISAKSNTIFIAIGALILLIIVLVVLYRRMGDTKIGQFIKGLGDGVKSIFKLKKRGLFLLYTVLLWFTYWIQVVFGFWSMPALEHLSGLTALITLIFGSIGMIATQGGIGAYTYLVADILNTYGIDKAYGQAFGWVSWAVQTGIILILGLASILFIMNRKRRNAQVKADN
ncbi:MAG: lysylphosphatidylglycerol synthase transmembrane domain-containing protein [Flavipsychrobacter sp.]